MTWICYIGIELSAPHPVLPAGGRDRHPGALRGRRPGQGLHRRAPDARCTSASTGSPRSALPGGSSALVDGVLLGVFIYWGWDSGRLRQRGVRGHRQRPGQGGGDEHDPAGPDLRRRRRRPPRRTPAPSFLKHHNERRAQRARRPRARLAAGQAADHRGADLGLGVDPDDDPADRADHAVDGALRRRSRRRSGDIHPRYLTPDVSTLVMGARLARLDAVHHQRQPERPRRLDHRARLPDRLLLRAHRLRLRDLLPQGALQERRRTSSWSGVAPFARRADARPCIFIKAFIDYKTRPDATYSGGFLGFGVAGRDRRRAAAGRRRGDGVRQLRLPEVLQAQVGDRRPRDPRGRRVKGEAR